MLILLGLSGIILGALFIGGLYALFQQSCEVYEPRVRSTNNSYLCRSNELDYIANGAQRAELRAQELGRLTRARITDIANTDRGERMLPQRRYDSSSPPTGIRGSLAPPFTAKRGGVN